MMRLFAQLLAGILLLLLVIGVLAIPAAAERQAAFPITVTDGLGRRVTVPAPPQRIVSLAPSHTEGLFAIGAGDKVVGVTTYDNYPPQVQRLEQVGGYVAKTISVEKILSLKPDLVLCRGLIQKPVIEVLERLGIPAVAIEPADVDEVYAAILLGGQLTGHLQQATQVVEAMRQRVTHLREKVATIPPMQRVTVFYKAYDEPLLTAGPSTFIGHMITMAGGINIFAELTESYPQVSAEEVLRRNPAVILSPASAGVPFSSTWAQRHPGWRHIDAIKHQRFYLLDDDLISRPGPRLVAGLEVMVQTLYPDLLPEGLHR
jgi:iron complex transport system substrate-binding protein